MNPQAPDTALAGQLHWLNRYYYLRAIVSFAWVAAAFTLGTRDATAAAALLVVYPAWDAIANYLDAQRNGGLATNKTQAINFAVSMVTTIAVALTLRLGMHAVLGVFGAWAILSGLLQLGTALKRRKRFGAQWAMILSGAQSALAGGFMIVQSLQAAMPTIVNVAGYAAVGAIYFLISALWLTVSRLRGRSAVTG